MRSHHPPIVRKNVFRSWLKETDTSSFDLPANWGDAPWQVLREMIWLRNGFLLRRPLRLWCGSQIWSSALTWRSDARQNVAEVSGNPVKELELWLETAGWKNAVKLRISELVVILFSLCSRTIEIIAESWAGLRSTVLNGFVQVVSMSGFLLQSRLRYAGICYWVLVHG